MLHRAGSLDSAVSHARAGATCSSASACWCCSARAWGWCWPPTGRARRLAAQQMEFVAGVSHELRTPLAVIRSAAENLADGVVADPKQVRRYGDVIAGEGRRLTQMVEQIMEFAGFESGRATLDVRPADLGGIVEEALRGADPLLREHHADHRRRGTTELPAVLVDPVGGVALAAEPDRQRAQVRRGAARRRGRRAAAPRARAARSAVTISDNGSRHRRPRPAAHLRAVLPRRRRHRAPDPRQRARPEPGQADHGRTGRADHACAPRPARAARSRCTCRWRRKARWPAARRSGPCGRARTGRSARAGLTSRSTPALRNSATQRRLICARLFAVARILIVEDEPGLVLTLTDRLGREGHVVESATDGREGLARALAGSRSTCSCST